MQKLGNFVNRLLVVLYIILVEMRRLLAVSLYPSQHYYVRKHGMYSAERKNSLTNVGA